MHPLLLRLPWSPTRTTRACRACRTLRLPLAISRCSRLLLIKQRQLAPHRPLTDQQPLLRGPLIQFQTERLIIPVLESSRGCHSLLIKRRWMVVIERVQIPVKVRHCHRIKLMRLKVRGRGTGTGRRRGELGRGRSGFHRIRYERCSCRKGGRLERLPLPLKVLDDLCDLGGSCIRDIRRVPSR